MIVRAILATTVALLAVPTIVAAAPGPATLVSLNDREQADRAVAPALSADGRYVAFEGAIAGLSGVFRKDLSTGALEVVAAGNAYAQPGASSPADASGPSISADGRYVSFTTVARLEPAGDMDALRDVYVRDMTAAAPVQCPTVACAYELASARDAERTGLGGGAVAAGRVALSGDGRRVVFVTLGPSALTSGPGASTPGVATPAGQVAVRDLDALRTTLVSVRRDALSGAATALPVPGGAVATTKRAGIDGGSAPGAALSADGTTVAWLATHVADQAPALADERTTLAGDAYNEPLWRRLADGPGAPTRRVLGGGDPLAPDCPADGTVKTPACAGPFPALVDNTERSGERNALGWMTLLTTIDAVPRLSADGRTVGLLGNPTQAVNVFVVDMRDGLSRVQAIHQLTREVVGNSQEPTQINAPQFIPLSGDIYDLTVSSDGNRLAFATARQVFPLAPPNLIGGAPSTLGLIELFRVDRAAHTLELITRPPEGGPSAAGGSSFAAQNGGGAAAPSFDASGALLAFASVASNLVAGDGNSASDVFVATEDVPVAAPGLVTISPPPPPLEFAPRWVLSARALRRPDGTVRVSTVTPGAGTLRISARASVRVKQKVRGKLGARTKRVQVAVVTARTARAGVVTASLRLTKRYRTLARTKGLAADLTVTFRGAGQPLKDSLTTTFRITPKKKTRR